jgi:hypothetical protein
MEDDHVANLGSVKRLPRRLTSTRWPICRVGTIDSLGMRYGLTRKAWMPRASPSATATMTTSSRANRRPTSAWWPLGPCRQRQARPRGGLAAVSLASAAPADPLSAAARPGPARPRRPPARQPRLQPGQRQRRLGLAVVAASAASTSATWSSACVVSAAPPASTTSSAVAPSASTAPEPRRLRLRAATGSCRRPALLAALGVVVREFLANTRRLA